MIKPQSNSQEWLRQSEYQSAQDEISYEYISFNVSNDLYVILIDMFHLLHYNQCNKLRYIVIYHNI